MRPFHSISYGWPNATRLLLEWKDGEEGRLLGAPPSVAFLTECREELCPDRKASVPPICFRDMEDSLFEPMQLRENTDYLIDITMPSAMHEAEAAWKNNRSWPLTTVQNAYESDPPRRWRFENGLVTITGRLNFRSYVGAAEIALPGVSPLIIEVVCTKLGYFEDFRQLLDSIAEEYSALLMEIESPTFARFSLAEASKPQLMTFLFLLRHAMDDSRLPASVEAILGAPRSMLVQYERMVPTSQLQQVARVDFLHRLPQGSLSAGGPLASIFMGHTPVVLPETVKLETTDTPENRYIKSFLENLLDAADDLHTLLDRHGKHIVANQVKTWSQRVSEWLEHPMWRDVRRMTHFPSNSQVLQKSSSYREVLGTDLRMQLGMTLPWSTDTQLEADVRGDLRPISQLYEYWCFFFLRSVLRNMCGDELRGAGSLIRETEDGLSVVLRRGTESRVRFRFKDEHGRSAIISLYYNRKFERSNSSVWDGSYSAQLNPDFSLLIDVVSDPDRMHWLHFDAKYRLDIAQWKSEVSDCTKQIEELEHELTTHEDARASVTYNRTDLLKMHTYRDALLGSRGSYVLFPGTEDAEDVFIRFPGVEYTENSIPIPSVGAFQASPSHHTSQSHRLERFIRTCIEALVSATAYQEESGLHSPEEL
jgi:predicted component of viral defense system (DUF524 family)